MAAPDLVRISPFTGTGYVHRADRFTPAFRPSPLDSISPTIRNWLNGWSHFGNGSTEEPAGGSNGIPRRHLGIALIEVRKMLDRERTKSISSPEA
jgi:hypothetical protein